MRPAAFLALLLTAAPGPAPGEPPPPEPVVALPSSAEEGRTVAVVPGGLVRWAGEGLVRCGDARETWTPVGGACLYPVDLGQPEGALGVFREGPAGAETATIRVLPAPYAEESLEVDPRKVKLSAKDRARVKRERAQVVPLFSLRTNPSFSLPLAPPLADAPPARNFGTRRTFNDEPRSAHGGADYRARTGTPVLAAEEGLVLLAAHHFFAGKSVYFYNVWGII